MNYLSSTLALTLPLAAASPGLGSGRLIPTAALAIALAGIVFARLAWVQYRRGGNGKLKAVTAIVFGAFSLFIGSLHAINSVSGFGTGNGRAGAFAAIILGLTSVVLGGMTLRKSPQNENRRNS